MRKKCKFMILILLLFILKGESEKEVYKVPPIIVEAQKEVFWFKGKEIKYELKYDHFFLGLAHYRVTKKIKFEGKICNEIIKTTYFNLERFGKEGRFLKNGMFVFSSEGRFMYNRFEVNCEEECIKSEAIYDGTQAGNNIVTHENRIISSDKECYAIDRREPLDWFVFFFYLFRGNKVKHGLEIEKDIVLAENNLKFDYYRNFDGDFDFNCEKKRIRIIIDPSKTMDFHGYELEVHECRIPELNYEFVVDKFGEVISFSDNNGYEAVLVNDYEKF